MKSINEKLENLYEINKSKFYGKAFPVFSFDEIKEILRQTRDEHFHATHVCYAYVLNGNEKCSDDGEPSGTAGKPILDVIKKKGLNNILIIVIRYFGGIKLGAGGLTRAYSTTASEVLLNAKFVEFEKAKLYECWLRYKDIAKYEKSFNSSLAIKDFKPKYDEYIDDKIKCEFILLKNNELPMLLSDAIFIKEIEVMKDANN